MEAVMPGELTRREFLARTTTGVAAVPFVGRLQGATQPPGMFVSLPPWAVARNVPWPEQARLAARTGYAGIDWAWGPAREAGVDATRQLLAELRLYPTIVNLPGPNVLTGDDAAFEARLSQLDADAAFASAIGCRRFQMVLGATVPDGQTKDERWAFVRSRLSGVSRVLARHDVRLGLEFLGPLQFRMGRSAGAGRRGSPSDPAAAPAPPPLPFVYTLAETVRLCAECGPNIGATLDAWHWYHSGGTVADILATDRSRIVHVHVSDARAMAPADVRDNMRLFAGEGVIDLAGFLQALKKIGWEGGIAPETIGPRVPDDMPPEESARLALAATTAVMKAAGVWSWTDAVDRASPTR
jgi:sugar phosphate isomerase/epimerase